MAELPFTSAQPLLLDPPNIQQLPGILLRPPTSGPFNSLASQLFTAIFLVLDFCLFACLLVFPLLLICLFLKLINSCRNHTLPIRNPSPNSVAGCLPHNFPGPTLHSFSTKLLPDQTRAGCSRTLHLGSEPFRYNGSCLTSHILSLALWTKNAHN